ncbi:MAG: phosphatidate cytidylyltransferase [Acidimicrobiales bacterium]
MSDDDGTLFNEPTGEMPVVSPTDSRVTITGAEIAAEAYDDTVQIDPTTLLPHWTDAPTGQVPIVVAREAADSDDPWSAIPSPAWREGEADWVAHEDQFDPSILAGESREDTARPWEFTLPDEAIFEEEEMAEAPRPEPDRIQRTRRSITSNPLAGRAVRQSNDRNFGRATLTGIVLAAAVTVVFILGAKPVFVMVLLVLGLAGAEAYAGFRAAGAHPATVLGIVAILTLGVAVYNKGLGSVGAITVLLLIFGFVWYLNAGRSVDVLDGLGATMFVFAWIGVLGTYAVMFVAPHNFVGGHGLSYLFGAMVLTVANDSGAFVIGRQYGKRALNKLLSPSKTLEGTIGGTVLTIIVGGLVLPIMSVWTRKAGLEAAVALSIIVPLGDLFESMVKRTIGVKDLGRLLPGHGGLLDRIDGLLFALPTMYYLCHVLKLG